MRNIRRSIEVEGLHHGGQPIPLACQIGNTLMSGSIAGVDPATSTLPQSVEEQCFHLFANVRRLVEAAGGSTENIVKMAFFVKDRSTRDAINKEWLAMFPDAHSRPARHITPADLQSPVLVQCELYAVLEERY